MHVQEMCARQTTAQSVLKIPSRQSFVLPARRASMPSSTMNCPSIFTSSAASVASSSTARLMAAATPWVRLSTCQQKLKSADKLCMTLCLQCELDVSQLSTYDNST